jgi:hypothetical protein
MTVAAHTPRIQKAGSSGLLSFVGCAVAGVAMIGIAAAETLVTHIETAQPGFDQRTGGAYLAPFSFRPAGAK